jgi:hypothetical protein
MDYLKQARGWWALALKEPRFAYSHIQHMKGSLRHANAEPEDIGVTQRHITDALTAEGLFCARGQWLLAKCDVRQADLHIRAMKDALKAVKKSYADIGLTEEMVQGVLKKT